MVAVVVFAGKGIRVPRAVRVVTGVAAFLVRVGVHLPVVAVEVGGSPEALAQAGDGELAGVDTFGCVAVGSSLVLV
jgi:hypothetical protein